MNFKPGSVQPVQEKATCNCQFIQQEMDKAILSPEFAQRTPILSRWIPPHVASQMRTWGELKQWTESNAQLVFPGLLELVEWIQMLECWDLVAKPWLNIAASEGGVCSLGPGKEHLEDPYLEFGRL